MRIPRFAKLQLVNVTGIWQVPRTVFRHTHRYEHFFSHFGKAIREPVSSIPPKPLDHGLLNVERFETEFWFRVETGNVR